MSQYLKCGGVNMIPQVESEDVVFTLETIVEKFGEEMAPYAVGLCQHLTQAFWRLQVGGCSFATGSFSPTCP